MGLASAIGEGEREGIGEGLGSNGCGVALDAAGWRLQSNSSKTPAIAALSLQKSPKGRSEKRLIAGEAEYLQAPGSPQSVSAGPTNVVVVGPERAKVLAGRYEALGPGP